MEYIKACGCHVKAPQDIDGVIELTYCSKHEAAPAMYEALKGMVEASGEQEPTALAWRIDRAARIAEQALSKADGK